MNHRDRMNLDEHIAGGRYSKWHVEVKCVKCGVREHIIGWTEYGTGGYDPEECPYCGEPYTERSERAAGGPEDDE